MHITAENYEENPILLSKVLRHEGKNIGYMVYNNFIGTDKANRNLNNNIGYLKSTGITELVLDLRYNSGGSLYTTNLLCSMLTGQYTGDLLFESEFNYYMSKYYMDKYGKDALKDFFTDKIKDNKGNILASINSLKLKRLFVLTSENSASASEQLINGLNPYIDVILIGEKTSGKYTSSITVYDYIDNDGTINPNHKWAMQPIVGKVANSKGYSDFSDGFEADYIRNEWEYLGQIKPLGDPEEPFLKTALDLISGKDVPKTLQTKTKANSQEFKRLSNSSETKPFSNKLIDDNYHRRNFNKPIVE